MSSGLGNGLVHALTGLTPSQRHRGSTFDMLRSLVGSAGSERKAAARIGIARATLHNILVGRTRAPKASTVDRIVHAFRSGQIREPIPTDAGVTIECYDNRDPNRTRSLSGDRLDLAPGTMRNAADAWVRTGKTEAVAVAFLAGVRDEWYQAWLAPLLDWTTEDGGLVDDDPDMPDPEDFDDEDFWALMLDLHGDIAEGGTRERDYGASVTGVS